MQCPNQVMLGNLRTEGLIGSTRAHVARLRSCPNGQRASLAAHVATDGTVGRHMKECSSEPPRIPLLALKLRAIHWFASRYCKIAARLNLGKEPKLPIGHRAGGLRSDER